jgi:hypothetical protein
MLIASIIITFILGFVLGESWYLHYEYWNRLTDFLNTRDEAIFNRVRKNQDHKYPQQ